MRSLIFGFVVFLCACLYSCSSAREQVVVQDQTSTSTADVGVFALASDELISLVSASAAMAFDSLVVDFYCPDSARALTRASPRRILLAGARVTVANDAVTKRSCSETVAQTVNLADSSASRVTTSTTTPSKTVRRVSWTVATAFLLLVAFAIWLFLRRLKL